MAAAVGRYEVGRDPDVEKRWPSWRYISGPNPRDAHAALDGRVFRKSDPVWKRIYPPWEFNCNCDVEDCDDAPETARPEEYPAPPDSGFKFDPSDAFGSYDLASVQDPAVRAIAEERAAEKIGKMRQSPEKGEAARIPLVRHPEFKNFEVPETRKAKAEFDAAMSAVGDVWKRDKTKGIPVSFFVPSENKDDDRYDGYVRVEGGRIAEVKIFGGKGRAHPGLTLLHETGHVIDRVFCGGRSPEIASARAELLAELKATPEYAELVKMRDRLLAEPKKTKSERKNLNWLREQLDDGELLARCYAQTVAKKSGGLLLEELENEAILNSKSFFSTENRAIGEKLDNLLSLAGLK